MIVSCCCCCEVDVVAVEVPLDNDCTSTLGDDDAYEGFVPEFEVDVSCEFVSDMDEAVVKASQCAESGDQVLLAPACASLDMYRNYEQRGDDFSAEVMQL